MLNVQNPDNQRVHGQGFYESLIVKTFVAKTTRSKIIYEIVYMFTDAMYRRHSAALGLFLAKGSAKKKKRMKVAPSSVWYSTW